MVSVCRRGDKWQVRVRRKGFPVGVKTILSLETAMRRGELLELRWTNVNLEAQTAYFR